MYESAPEEELQERLPGDAPGARVGVPVPDLYEFPDQGRPGDTTNGGVLRGR